MQEPVTGTDARREEREDDDVVLMRRIAEGDEAAFRTLMRRHLAAAVRTAVRILGSADRADDAAQEAFIRVWKHAPDWRPPEDGVDAANRRLGKFSTWFYRILLNLCLDEKRKKPFAALDDAPEQAADARLQPEELLAQRELAQRVRQALDTLPERQRAAFVLCFYEGFSNQEAADAMGIGIKALEALLVRARRSLRDLLQGEKMGE